MLLRMMCNQRKLSPNKNCKLLAHWSNKPKKPWTQLKRKTSKSLNHSLILQEVFLKYSQPPFGYCQVSLRKSILIQKLKNPNNSIGKPPKSLWRIPVLSWQLCLDSKKSSMETKFQLLTSHKLRKHIYQTQVSIRLSLKQNQRLLPVCVHGCSTSLSSTTSFKKLVHYVNNCKKPNYNCKWLQLS